jgi:hypothetical protein
MVSVQACAALDEVRRDARRGRRSADDAPDPEAIRTVADENGPSEDTVVRRGTR